MLLIGTVRLNSTFCMSGLRAWHALQSLRLLSLSKYEVVLEQRQHHAAAGKVVE
jgi:hypothetical protein